MSSIDEQQDAKLVQLPGDGGDGEDDGGGGGDVVHLGRDVDIRAFSVKIIEFVGFLLTMARRMPVFFLQISTTCSTTSSSLRIGNLRW